MDDVESSMGVISKPLEGCKFWDTSLVVEISFPDIVGGLSWSSPSAAQTYSKSTSGGQLTSYQAGGT